LGHFLHEKSFVYIEIIFLRSKFRYISPNKEEKGTLPLTYLLSALIFVGGAFEILIGDAAILELVGRSRNSSVEHLLAE
jgi:hypothetical protein